jgi:hypothetical protein
MAPSITLYGTLDPKTKSIDPERYAEVLETRLHVEQAVADEHRQQDNNYVGNWSVGIGLYDPSTDNDGRLLPLSSQNLSKKEARIADSIAENLQAQTDGRPVVALDFGGGLGLSWMRIAAQPQYRDAIEKGKLIMAVTNLGSTPDQTPDAEGYSGISRSMNTTTKLGHATGQRATFTPGDMQWSHENQGRLQYLDANALELPNMAVTLPDGTPVPLNGNVGVINEEFALRHTHVPDLALASFNKLLNTNGTLHSDAATHYHLMEYAPFSSITVENGDVVEMTSEYYYQRELALAIGSRMLQQQEFSYVVSGSNGIFKRI